MSMRVGHILRHEDESGVSGTGVVAEWIEYSDGEVVVHWLSHTPSTNHYRNIKQLEQIHGHGGKTEMVTIWEEPKPERSADSEIVQEAELAAAEAQPKANELATPEKAPAKDAKKSGAKKGESRKKASTKK